MPTKGSIDRLLEAARHAHKGQQFAAAVSLYSDILARPNLSPTLTILLHSDKAECHAHLGELHAQREALEAIYKITRTQGDIVLQIKTLNRLVMVCRQTGDLNGGLGYAQTAVSLAEQVEKADLHADSLIKLGRIFEQQGDFAQAKEKFAHALRLARTTEHPELIARTLIRLGSLAFRAGQAEEMATYVLEALQIRQTLGDQEGEASAYNMLGIACQDLARRRTYFEKALRIYATIGNQEQQAMMHNNLGLVYWGLGLYVRAQSYFAQALAFGRKAQALSNLVMFLDSNGRCYLDLAQFEKAAESFAEACHFAHEIGSQADVALCTLGLGRSLLGMKKLEEAQTYLETAVSLFDTLEMHAEKATALAWLGHTQAQQGRFHQARYATHEASQLLQSVNNFSTEYLPQEVWWLHYQASQKEADAWDILDTACQIMLDGITHLSDEGLRRNYLNKVVVNQKIVAQWVQEAPQHGISLDLFTDRNTQGSPIADQLQRMLDIGLRLAKLRNNNELPQFILEEFIELSGPHRALLLLYNRETDAYDIKVSRGFAPQRDDPHAQMNNLTTIKQPTIAQLIQTEQATVATVQQDENDPREQSVLNKTSTLTIPLIARNNLLGVLYGDMCAIYGRFTPADLNILTVLANQAAVALENVAWATTLESQVAQRTKELKATNERLQRRTNELTIINNIGNILSQQFDQETLIQHIGQELEEIFNADTVEITQYNPSTHLIHSLYYIDNGQHHNNLPPLTDEEGLTSIVVQTKRPLLLGTAQIQADLAAVNVPSNREGVDQNESFLCVPILISEEIKGTISVQSYAPHAYRQSHLRLLVTIAANCAVALENARLFTETNRLLQETQQRAAELSTVNKVSRAIVSELELATLINLIGTQIQDVFSADVVYVALYDADAQIIHFPYMYGQTVERTIQFGEGFTSRIIESRSPLLINKDVDARGAELKMERLGVKSQSYLGVPIIIGTDVVGVISAQSTQMEERFQASDLNLLSTIAAHVAVALENARLFESTQKAQADAEAASKAKSVFLASMSHELRTPLNSIMGFTRLVRRHGADVLPEKQLNNLDKVLLSSEHLLSLINNILDIAKIEAGRMDVHMQEFNLGQLVQICMATIRPLLHTAVSLQHTIPDILPPIHSDEDKVKQILINLLSNAAKFTQEGFIHIQIEHNDNQFHITIADSGIGISQELLNKIFEEFRQVDVQIRNQFGGSGLGLPISRNLAHLLGGTLTAVSQPNKGSTFTLTLPQTLSSSLSKE